MAASSSYSQFSSAIFDENEVLEAINDYFGEVNSTELDSSSESDEELDIVDADASAEDVLIQLETDASQETNSNLNTFVRAAEFAGEFYDNHYTLCGCTCKKGPNNTRCIEQFSQEQLTSSRLSAFELNSELKDVAILSAIQCGYHMSSTTVNTKRKSQTDRKQSRANYFYLNADVCVQTLSYVFATSHKTLKVLLKHFKDVKSVIPRKLKSGNQAQITYEESKDFHQFMKNFLEQHSLVLPGRMSGITKHATEILPSSFTKKLVYQAYAQASHLDSTRRTLSFSSFLRLWKLLFPTVSICRPMSDLCWTCQKNNTLIYQ